MTAKYNIFYLLFLRNDRKIVGISKKQFYNNEINYSLFCKDNWCSIRKYISSLNLKTNKLDIIKYILFKEGFIIGE